MINERHLPLFRITAHLSEVADRGDRKHDCILVTSNGRPSFVLLSPDDLAALEESLDILHDDELRESLRISRRQAADGDTVPLRDQI
jgi:antitoxin YefM